ncbi:MAG: tetratricopeptide repeat protein, partial [Pedobacter sp.]
DGSSRNQVVFVASARHRPFPVSAYTDYRRLKARLAACDRILVMKAGAIAESGTADQIYNHPKNEYTKALTDYERALQINPKEPGIYYFRGVTFMKMGRKNEAVADMRKVLDLKPNDSKATAALKQLGVAQ